MHKNTISILNDDKLSPVLLSFKPSPLETKKVEDVYVDRAGILLSNSEMASIIRNFNNFDFLNEKFDELREKEMEGTLTAFEKSLMDVVVKKILELPNPYRPPDHEKGMALVRKYDLIEEKEAKEKKARLFQKRGWFNILFSWLG